jgi:hypothetical protein
MKITFKRKNHKCLTVGAETNVLWQNNAEILSVLSFRVIIWPMLWIRANGSDLFFCQESEMYIVVYEPLTALKL